MKRPCSTAFWLLYGSAVLAVVSASCGMPAALAAEEEVTEDPSEVAALPEWAPEEPSEEFLRAVQVLGFIPRQEVLPEGADAEMAAFLTAMTEILWPRSFEFFGSLSDEQVQKFLAEQEIRLPIPLLPSSQKTALDRWLAAADELIMRAPEAARPVDQTLAKGGYLAVLQEQGAQEDLSNVDVGFKARRGVVGVYFWIKRSAGGQGPTINNDFAKLKPREVPKSAE